MTRPLLKVETLDRATHEALRRREFLDAGKASKATYERDRVAFAHTDVVRHFKARLAGEKAPGLEPVKRGRARK